MSIRIITALALALGLTGAAQAASETWLVSEENTGGIRGAQGTWEVNSEGAKVSGSAQMMTDKGGQLTYKIDGSVADGVYTLTLTDRTDGKKGCVWSGHLPSTASSQKQGLSGYAECEGSKLIIRASAAPAH